jgi:hypothetical protein
MKAIQLSEAIVAMQRAYDYIAANVSPGKHGKVLTMAALASASRELSYEFPVTEIKVEAEVQPELKAA